MRHAVYTERGFDADIFLPLGESLVATLAYPTLANILKKMAAERIDVLWVMPGTGLSHAISTEYLDDLKPDYHVFYPQKKWHKKPSFVLVREERRGAREMFLSFPEYREWKAPKDGDRGMWTIPEPDYVLRIIAALESEYKHPVLWSPSYIGMEVLVDIHLEQGKSIFPLPEEQRKPFLHMARDMCNWIQWATDRPLRKKYIVGYDKNAQFLGAAGSLVLGNGGYKEVGAFRDTEPGFWHYRILDTVMPEGGSFPCPLDRVVGIAHTDLINAALHVGVQLVVESGIVWDWGEKYLSRWAKEMWHHRVNMHQIEDALVRMNCESTAKIIPNSMVGRVANETSGDYYHPDWNRAIVNRATANQIYSLHRIWRDFGIVPILVAKDAFYVESDEADPALAIPDILKYEHAQRGYKAIGTCPINGTIIDAFATRKVGEIEKVVKEGMQFYGG